MPVRSVFQLAAPAILLAPGAHRVETSARHLADLATERRFARMTGAYVVDDAPSGSSIASHDMAANAAVYRRTLDVIDARHLVRPGELPSCTESSEPV